MSARQTTNRSGKMDYIKESDSHEVIAEKMKVLGIGWGLFFFGILLGGKLGMGENSFIAGFFTIPITFYIVYKRVLKEEAKNAKDGVNHEK